MIQWLTLWWHRVILRHPQESVMNGATEAGVWCKCPRLGFRIVDVPWGELPYTVRNRRWFPSDGGRGR